MRRKLALLAASLLLALGLAEILLREAGGGAAQRGAAWYAGGNHPRYLFQPDPELGYALRPGFSGTEISISGEFSRLVRIDARGFRDEPHPAPPEPVVLALGDSMTFGEGVDAGETYSARLESALGVRVVNAGTPGYGSRQMNGYLARLLPALRPRLVVVTLVPLWDAPRCAAPFVYKDGFIVGSGYVDRLMEIDGNLFLMHGPGAFGRFSAWFAAHSAVARLAIPTAAAGLRGLRSPTPGPAAPSDNFGPTRAALEAMSGGAAGAGARFLLILADSPAEPFARAREQLEAALADLKIDIVALDRAAPAAPWGELHYPKDLHWNAAGHARVAEVLAPLVRARWVNSQP